MTVELNITQEPLPAEDSAVTAKITRNEIGIEGSFDVTVTAEPLSHSINLNRNQQRALPDGPYKGYYIDIIVFIEVFLIRFYIW